MSLILDALQQAEHERRGQQAPELFSATPMPPSSAPVPSTRPAPWALLAMATVLGTLAALAWWQVYPAPPTPARPVPPAPAAPAMLPPPATAQPTPRSGTAETGPATSAPAGTPPFAPRATTTEAIPAVLPDVRTATPASATPAATATAASTAASAPPPAGTPAPGGVASLTPEQRALLPHLTVTGHTYSDNPTLRSLMIDGRMFVEGQALAPGLRLERIGSYQAVFNLQGTRFTVDY